ncbi:uncharacterized protein [Lolium perenne]|uniref:uncharacterized protein n=1 Tax=Lolium perenne TaxID=4522 RepID=UPI0021F5A76F|nr:uncharacterized protein LOC127314007 [Lolium perenne]
MQPQPTTDVAMSDVPKGGDDLGGSGDDHAFGNAADREMKGSRSNLAKENNQEGTNGSMPHNSGHVLAKSPICTDPVLVVQKMTTPHMVIPVKQNQTSDNTVRLSSVSATSGSVENVETENRNQKSTSSKQNGIIGDTVSVQNEGIKIVKEPVMLNLNSGADGEDYQRRLLHPAHNHSHEAETTLIGEDARPRQTAQVEGKEPLLQPVCPTANFNGPRPAPLCFKGTELQPNMHGDCGSRDGAISFSRDEIIEFGGIPEPSSKGTRASARIGAQVNTDDTQMERAMCATQRRLNPSLPGYSSCGALDTAMGAYASGGLAGYYVYWMQSPAQGHAGLLFPGYWMASY